MCYLVGPMPMDADTGLSLVILDAMSMLAQDTHWKAGESLLEQTSLLIPVLNGDSLLCDCKSTAAACVSHPSTTGEMLCKML